MDDSTWGSPVINMPQDAVQEFKVFRNQFDAQYGSALNAVVNVVTKSGTNDYNGSAYYFGRDDALNARNAAATTVPPFSQTRVGGTFGGPLQLNRTHFFGSYEYLEHRQGGDRVAASVQPVRDDAERQLPVHLDREPCQRPSRSPLDQSQSMFVRYSFDRQYTPSGGPDNAASSIVDTSKSHIIVGEHNWVLSQSKVNTLRITWLNHNLFTEPTNYDLQEARPSVHVRPERCRSAVLPAQHVRDVRDVLFHHAAARDQDGRRADVRLEQLRSAFHRARCIQLPDRHAIQRAGANDLAEHVRPAGARVLQLQVEADRGLHPGQLARREPGAPQPRLRYDLDTNIRQNDLYGQLLADPLYCRDRPLRQRRPRKRLRQHPAAPRCHLRPPG